MRGAGRGVCAYYALLLQLCVCGGGGGGAKLNIVKRICYFTPESNQSDITIHVKIVSIQTNLYFSL